MSVYIVVLTEGAADVPVVDVMLSKHFGLKPQEHYRIHPHAGKGKLPQHIHKKPASHHRGLLDQLPAKLRSYGKSLPPDALVLVLIDLDDGDCQQMMSSLQDMYANLDSKPARVLFRIAVEETESWFLADYEALKLGFPGAKIQKIKSILPDAIVGAWEEVAKSIGVKTNSVTGRDKFEWASKIAPHLNFQNPRSPSLAKLVEGTSGYLLEAQA